MRNALVSKRLKHVSKIFVLKLCLVSHSCLLTLLPVWLTILIVSVPVDKKHVHCGLWLDKDSMEGEILCTYAEEINGTRV